MAHLRRVSVRGRHFWLVASSISLFQLLVSPAHSAPKIVQGFYEEDKGKGCSNTSHCSLSFTAIPAGKTFIMSGISCMFQSTGAAQLGVVELGFARRSYLTPVQLGTTAAGKRIYQSNDQISKIYEAGESPFITANWTATVTSSAVICTISGKLLP